MSVTTYHAPNGAAKVVATTLRNLGYVSPEPTGSGSQEAMMAEGSGPGLRTDHVELSPHWWLEPFLQAPSAKKMPLNMQR